jgi:hypothetical protein
MERRPGTMRFSRLALLAGMLAVALSKTSVRADIVVSGGAASGGTRLEIADESTPKADWMAATDSFAAFGIPVEASEMAYITGPYYKRPGTVAVTESPVASFLAFGMFAAGFYYLLGHRQRKPAV